MTLFSSSSYVVSLDVGGSSVKSALVTQAGGVVGEASETPINSGGSAETILATFAAIIARQTARVSPENLIGLAFGFPGPADYLAGISYMREQAKYDAIYGLNLKDELRRRLALPADLPIAFRNDAEAAIIGEADYGAGKPYRRLIGLTLGTGFGSSFVVDGVRLTAGKGVPPGDGFLFPEIFEGRRADDYFSTRGLQASLRQAGLEPDIKQAAARARAGDPVAGQVFAQFGRDLGRFLRPYVVDFEAEMLLVLGGIANAFDLFAPMLAAALPAPVYRGSLGAHAALLGAAALFLTNPSLGRPE